MATTVLKRAKFTARAEVRLPDLFAEAKAKLGYEPKALTDQQIFEVRRQQEIKIAAALDSLGIEPLDVESVERYQRQEVSKVVSRGATRFVRYMHSEKGETFVTLLGIVTGLLFGALAAAAGVFADDKTYAPHHKQVLSLLFELWLMLPVAWTALMVARHKRAVTFSAGWKATQLRYYRQPVPEFALARALQVNGVLPEAQFVIQTLEEQARNVPVDYHPAPPDPFLVMYLGDIAVYLDVWDEPKFEGRRTV